MDRTENTGGWRLHPPIVSTSWLSSMKVFNLLFITPVKDVLPPHAPSACFSHSSRLRCLLGVIVRRLARACAVFGSAAHYTHTHTHTAECTSSCLLGFTVRIFMRAYVFESTWRSINGARREPGTTAAAAVNLRLCR